MIPLLQPERKEGGGVRWLHVSPHPALSRVTTSVVTKTIPIYKEVPAPTKTEQPPTTEGRHAAQSLAALRGSPFSK